MRRNEQICARVTLDEMRQLRELAARQQILLSEFIRRALTEKVTRLTETRIQSVFPLSERI